MPRLFGTGGGVGDVTQEELDDAQDTLQANIDANGALVNQGVRVVVYTAGSWPSVVRSGDTRIYLWIGPSEPTVDLATNDLFVSTL